MTNFFYQLMIFTDFSFSRRFFTKKVEIENKTPVITDLVTKTALNTKSEEIENKVHSTISFIILPEFKRLTEIRFDTWMTQAKIRLYLSDQNRKNRKTSNVWFKLFPLRKSFWRWSAVNYLVFEPVFKYFKTSTKY